MNGNIPRKRKLKYATRKKSERGFDIPKKRIEQLNELYWEQGMSPPKILKEAKVGDSLLNRALFQTRDEWNKFKQTI